MAIIDFVRWNVEGQNELFAWKFPESNLSTYTQLVVQESQEAILFSKGKIFAKFGPGKHTLSTENIPVLRSLFGLPFGGNNPFVAEVWFVNLVYNFSIDWAVDRMDIHDADYNTGIPLIARGKYGLKVKDSEKFLLKIVGTKSSFSQHELTEQFYGEFATKTKSTLVQFMLQNAIGIKTVSAHLDSISNHLRSALVTFWDEIGFDLTKFYVTNVEVDSTSETGARVLDAICRQSAQAIGGYTWQQSQAFEVANRATDGAAGSGNGGLLGVVMATSLLGGMGGGGGAMLQPQYGQPSFRPGQMGAPGQAMPGQPQGQPGTSAKEVFCSNCSKKFPSSSKFCPHCGDPYHGCPRCGSDNDANAKKCVSCGQALGAGLQPQSCVKCGTPMDPGSQFCANCGQASLERKCTRCGSALSNSSKFCTKCGQKS